MPDNIPLEPGQVLRRIFPGVSYCPACGDHHWKKTGTSKAGGVQYRQCTSCNEKYKVGPIGLEIYTAEGESSHIRSL